MIASVSNDLAELAHAFGVATEYWDWQGKHVVVAEATVRAALSALGQPAGTDDEVAAALTRIADREWRRAAPPVLVIKQSEAGRVLVHLPHGHDLEVTLELEDGVRQRARQLEHNVDPRPVDGVLTGEAAFEIPAGLPLGWHTIAAEFDGATATTVLVVTPDRLTVPASVSNKPASGIMSQVYAGRSAGSWGMGDLGDLRDMVEWGAADLHADFVLVNPLHAAQPTAPVEASPYLPTTRRFVNPLYIRVEDVPEVAYLDVDTRAQVRALASKAAKLNEVDRIDRDASWELKDEALRLIFAAPRSAGRERALQRFKTREGRGLIDFATWCALVVEHGQDWHAWPAALRDPRGPGVAKAAAALADEIEYFCWLQWVLDEQLDQIQRSARSAGMRLGIIHDLAVGVHPDGADSWGLRDALARGVSVGAPADQYNQLGQDWSQPPWRPDRLAEQAYLPYRDMLRTVLRSAGGIRVDHIIGLFRLWWIPQGQKPFEGTYVRYDHKALIGILCLEAHRAGAVVIGEDLGTVEPWMREYLADRGVMGTSILWFEKDYAGDGKLIAPEKYRRLCLATVTTHDLPPTAGYLKGVHLELREKLGLLTEPIEIAERQEAEDRATVDASLAERKLLREGATDADLIEALHRYLSWTPSLLRGISVADLAGDTRIINQPGTDKEYPNWCVPLAGPDGRPLPLEKLYASPWAIRLADTLK